VRVAGFDDEVVDGAPALSKRCVNREHAFEEAAAVVGLRSEGCLADDDRAADRALADVVGGLDALAVDEGPESGLLAEQTLARAPGLAAWGQLSLLQQKDDALLQLAHVALEGASRQGAVAHAVPPGEHLILLSDEREADGLGLRVAPLREAHEQAGQMRPIQCTG